MRVRAGLGSALLAFTAFAPAGAADSDYRWTLPRGFPMPAVPADNPMSAAKVALGRRLFFEPKLSVTGRYSCGSCHQPSRAFSDGLKVAVGATGQHTPTNAMSLTNVAYNVSFGWSAPTVRSLEDQMRQPMLNDHPVEMGLKGRETEVVATLIAAPGWRAAFTAAFPEVGGHFELDHLIKAIAAFERTLISGHSPFDEYVFNGKHDALTAQAKRGMALFYSERLGCGSCHSGFNFAGAWRDAQGATGEPSFASNGIGPVAARVPTLRNVASTAPYMHDGSLSTLEAVLDHYEQAGQRAATKIDNQKPAGAHEEPTLRPFTLTGAERRELIAFLQSLTDPTFTAGFDGERTHSVSR
ncbi:MAG: cytochrome c peroxidase [Gammaproteobacteria bacterium]